MKIVVAPSAGFCFGVERAVRKTNEIAENEKRTRVFTLGKLIHNPDIIRKMEANGIHETDEASLEGLAASASTDQPVKVIVRAHGIPRETEEKLSLLSRKNPAFSVEDCTCPNVKKIHKIVDENSSSDSTLLIVGDAEHPEVVGIRSFSHGNVVIVNSPEELSSVKFDKSKVIMVAQTTQNSKKWDVCKKLIRNLCSDTYIYDTICNATEKRQCEAEKLSRETDGVVIIGGRNSSNTQKLFEIAKEHQPKSILIENADELDLSFFRNLSTVGVTAGASTPGSAIEEVVNKMDELNRNAATASAEEANDEASFASMLEESLKTLNTGEVIKGIVTSVSANEVHVDLGAKVTGIIPFDEVTDITSVKLEDLFKPGDEVEAIVTRVSDLDGVATLSKKRLDSIKNWSKIVEAEQSGEILEGKIVDVVKGGVIINIDSVRVFIPAFHTGIPKEGDLSVLNGTTQKVKIYEINEQRKRAYASIRKASGELRHAVQEKFWSEIEVGKVYTGKIKSMMSYGVFVDLGGADGMVHTSELSWKRIKNPSEVVSLGDEITVTVKAIETDDKGKKRISLTMKNPEQDPWNLFTSKYQKGDTCQAKIVNLMPFGAFAELLPGIDGLIHISQICDKKINHPSDVLKKDEVVDVKIIDIDAENRKISLSILALTKPEEPAAEEAPAEN